MLKTKYAGLPAVMLAAALQGMPAGLGQQQKLETKPGSAYTRTRDRHSFWGGTVERKPRTRTPEQIAKHAAKLMRRRQRWVRGLAHNQCITSVQFCALTGRTNSIDAANVT